jgi:hypothetical protein
MKLDRKQAMLGLFAGLFVWGKRANAQQPQTLPAGDDARVKGLEAQVNTLAAQVQALQTQLASQVAFAKDASGNLSLNAGSGNVRLSGASLNLVAAQNASLQAGGGATIAATQVSVTGQANTTLSGAQVAINGAATVSVKGALVTLN